MTLIIFILILSLLVFVHELGHFVAARKAGIKVEEFAFGLPFTKPIFSRKKGETLYSIYPLPFGGFVRLYGEDGETALSDKPEAGRAYFEKSIPRRLSVLLAGVFMNLVLALVCFSVLYLVLGIPTKTGKVVVETIVEDSPAQLADLRPGDWIVGINNVRITQSSQLIQAASGNSGKSVELEVFRNADNPCVLLNQNELGLAISTEIRCLGENMLLNVVPRVNPPEGEGPLGVVISDTEYKKYPFYLMPFLGAREGIKESIVWGKMVLQSLGKMFSVLITQGKVPKDIAGPVGIYQITGEAAKAGFLAVLQFIGILSVNLAIVNILPLPAMDGGKIIFLVYELVLRKKAPQKVEVWVNGIGMAFLLGLMFLITINDIMRLIGKP